MMYRNNNNQLSDTCTIKNYKNYIFLYIVDKCIYVCVTICRKKKRKKKPEC